MSQIRVYGFSSTPSTPWGRLRIRRSSKRRCARGSASSPLRGYIRDSNGAPAGEPRLPIPLPRLSRLPCWARVSGLASIPLEGRISDPMGFRGYARRGGCASTGSSIGRAYPFQQVAHEGDTFPISWLLVDTHAFASLLAGEPPLAPALSGRAILRGERGHVASDRTFSPARFFRYCSSK